MTTPCIQGDRIVRVEKSVDVIEAKVDTLTSDIRDLHTKLTPFVERVTTHEEILRGRAGESGLVSKVNENDAKLDEIYLAFKGTGDKPGIVGLLAEIKNKIMAGEDSQKWLFRLVAGALILSVISDVVKIGN